MMSSPLNSWLNIAIFSALHLLIILIVALVLNRLLRGFTNALVKPAAAQTRAAQAHEQQSRGVADALYDVGSKLVWLVALLTALPEFGIAAWPGVALGGLALLALGFGAQNTVRDLIAGSHIVLEDHYAVGDTIRIGEVAGRVEQLTLRRTVVRDSRGAMVTLANGDIRQAANLSRDYSQAFVDIAVAGDDCRKPRLGGGRLGARPDRIGRQDGELAKAVESSSAGDPDGAFTILENTEDDVA